MKKGDIVAPFFYIKIYIIMIILNQNQLNTIYFTLSESLDDSIFGTYSVMSCNLYLDYYFNFYDKNTKLTNSLILTDISLHPNRYNEFEIDLTGATTSFSNVGTYTYEAFFYDGVGATGSCLEKGMLKVEGDTYPTEYTRGNTGSYIYVRKNN